MQDRASGGAVRVLIASRAAEAVAGLEKLAGYSDLVSLVGFVRYPYELDEDLETLRPDLVLLHPDFATLDTPNLVRALTARRPDVRVVVVIDQTTEPLRARLEEAGAATVPFDVQDEELVAAICRAAGQTPTPLDEEAAPLPGIAPFEPFPAEEPAVSQAPPPPARWQPYAAPAGLAGAQPGPEEAAPPPELTDRYDVPVFDIDAAVALPTSDPVAPGTPPGSAPAEVPPPPAAAGMSDAAPLGGGGAAPPWETEPPPPPEDLMPAGEPLTDLTPALAPPADLMPAGEPPTDLTPALAPPADLMPAGAREAPGLPAPQADPEAMPAEPAAPSAAEPVSTPPDDVVRPSEGVPVFHLDTAAQETAPALAPVTPPSAEPEPIQPVRPRRPRRSSGRADLVVVFSGKGGVGKSLVATNLAVALAAGGGRVALVDLDLQFGDIGVMTHTESHPTAIDSLAPQGEQVEADFIDEVMADGPEGVRALLAPSSPEFADLVNTANLRAILRELAKSYDHVIVDTPSHLEERNLEAIEMADQIVVVTSFNLASIKDTKVTLKLLQSLGIAKDRLCVVLNQTRAKAGFPRSEVEESLRFRVVTVLPFEPRVDDYIDSGRPFVTAEPKAELSRQLQVLAGHLTGRAPGAGETADDERPRAGRAGRRRFSLGRG